MLSPEDLKIAPSSAAIRRAMVADKQTPVPSAVELGARLDEEREIVVQALEAAMTAAWNGRLFDLGETAFNCEEFAGVSEAALRFHEKGMTPIYKSMAMTMETGGCGFLLVAHEGMYTWLMAALRPDGIVGWTLMVRIDARDRQSLTGVGVPGKWKAMVPVTVIALAVASMAPLVSERVVVDEKLNRARVKKSRLPIPPHFRVTMREAENTCWGMMEMQAPLSRMTQTRRAEA